MGKRETVKTAPQFDSAKWCWDTADLLAQEYIAFFQKTGGIGKLELFYRETTTLADGVIHFYDSNSDTFPSGMISAGFSTRGQFTRDQLTTRCHDILRRIPCLPISQELMRAAILRAEQGAQGDK